MSNGLRPTNNDRDHLPVQKSLHTKCANPKKLTNELKHLIGPDVEFKVEMRHNMYNIMSSKPFDLDELLTKLGFPPLSRTSSIDSEVEKEKPAAVAA